MRMHSGTHTHTHTLKHTCTHMYVTSPVPIMPCASPIAILLPLSQGGGSLICLPYELPKGFVPITSPKTGIEPGIYQVLNKYSLSEDMCHLANPCDVLTKHVTYFTPH